VGFYMSWILVDGIDQDTLYEAIDLAPTDETPDMYDLGTSAVPKALAMTLSNTQLLSPVSRWPQRQQHDLAASSARLEEIVLPIQPEIFGTE
jgi:hypothetical protein